jgi:hypothetical protein
MAVRDQEKGQSFGQDKNQDLQDFYVQGLTVC